jgi:predicted CxxxxCH...CXXCH cytochrome family protein
MNTVNKDALSHFGNKTSKHPVGVNMSTDTETSGEVLSTIGSAQANELDCIDCHDPVLLDTVGTTLDYFTHGPTVANPYMLRNVTVLNEYENHCRTCHGASAPAIKGQNVQLTATKAHLDSNTGNAITENDGTPIVPRDGATAVNANDECRACHDSHYSNVAGLFNDGHEKHKNGAGTAVTDAAITPTNCTTVCHYRGDQYGNFDTHGHGKANAISGGVMGLACINCHDSGAEHAGTNANYKIKNRLTYFPDAAGDVSSFGNPLYSICKQCHGEKLIHKSDVDPKFASGCIDCHDEHAEGSGTASNVYMIPQKPKPAGTYGVPSTFRDLRADKKGTETVWYEKGLDFYSSKTDATGGQGVCDVIECHGNGVARGFGSLANMMSTTHPVGSKAAESDCATACHPHEGDPAGGFRGEASCTLCHGQPPTSAITQYPDYGDHNESRTPHAKHTKPNASGGMSYSCDECHQMGTDNATHDTTPRSYESVWFNSGKNPSRTAYPSTVDYTTATSTCNNLYCHSSGSSTSAKGSIQWMSALGAPDWSVADLACTACHNNGAGKSYPADAAGNHARHVEYGGTTGAIIDCEHCHNSTTTNGTSINYLGNTHVDKTKTVAAGGTFAGATIAFNFTQGTDQCANISCHGGWTSVTWATGHSATCNNCHGSFASAAGMSPNTVTKHGTASWTDADFSIKHAAGTVVSDSEFEETCAYCHANQTGGPYTTAKHMDNKIQLNVYMAYQGTSGAGGGGVGCSGVCHVVGAPYVMADSGYVFENLSGASMGCFACHGNGLNQYWPDGASSPDRVGQHNIHITRLAARLNYTPAPSYTDLQQKMMCSYCHPNATGSGSAAFTAAHNKGTGSVTGYVDYLWSTISATEQTDAGATYVVADGTCANIGCHYEKSTGTSAAGYGWYTANNGSCTVCHTIGGAGTANPTSGLHTGTLKTTAVNHDDSFPTAGTCGSCHLIPASTATSTHVNGGTPANTSANTSADFYLFTAYTDSSASCAGIQVGTNCHDGTGDAGTWARKWSTTARNSDGSECANCHGGINKTDWTFGAGAHNTNDGNVEHNYSWDTDASTESVGKHAGDTNQLDRCDVCHVYADTNYTTNAGAHIGWLGNGANNSTYHGDGSLTMNSNATAVRYNATSYGCDGQSCHDTGTTATPHRLEDSRWNLRFVQGPAGACNACHGQTNGNYWPDGATSPDRIGQHDIHISRIATKLGYGAGPTYSDANQKVMCSYCHPNAAGVGSQFADNHMKGSGTITGYVDAIWSTINASVESYDTNGAYNSADGSCTNVDCHNNNTTGTSATGYGWFTANVAKCDMCHNPGGTGTADPTSGLHNNVSLPKVTGVAHDDSFPTGGTCTTCHVYVPTYSAASTHINGSEPTYGSANTTADFYVFTAYTDSTAACSGAPVNVNCHDGIGDAGSWARKWSTSARNSDGTECANCHGGINETDWTFGTGTHNATDGNVEHNYSWDGDVTSSEVVGSHSGAPGGQATTCDTCHVYRFAATYTTNAGGHIGWVANAGNTSTHHGDGSVTLNSNATLKYNSTSYGCDLVSCHDTGTAAVGHHLEKSRWGVRLAVGPAGSCEGCHTAGGSGQIVTSASTHTKRGSASGYSTYNSCGDCHAGHATSATSILIPNFTQVGIYYTMKNPTGFNLGGSATGAKTTEAEMCWYCHLNATYQGTAVLSEWGVNCNANTGSYVYNYGSISNASGIWNGATWSTGTRIFSYKDAAIQSTHTANPFMTGYNSTTPVKGPATNLTGAMYKWTETADATGSIRCSYCHDVHNLNKATGDTVSGTPYLRGTWKGNPFKEDGAPMSAGSTFPAQGNMNSAGGANCIPRGRAVTATTTTMGGFWIDQNSSTPQAAWTQANSWGLCGLCHGTSVGSLDVHTGENAWINSAKNGHVGVMAATAQNVTNIFDYSHGRQTPSPAASWTGSVAYGVIANQGDQAIKAAAAEGYHYRGSDGANSYMKPLPTINTRYAFNSYNWGASVNGTTTNSSYHKFMCSKCHNPHASRLPKLLITNCLDVKHNTWDDNKSTQSRWTNASLRDRSKQVAYYNTAVNCHRYESLYSTAAEPYKPGWNKVSPW